MSTMLSDTFAILFFAELLRLLAYLKDCNNGEDKEKEETDDR